MGINMELETPFAAITACSLLGRLSTRCWNIAAVTCFHSATRALVRSGTDVGQFGLARMAIQIIPKVFDGVQVRALCSPVKFFHTDLDKSFCMDLVWCTGALSCWNSKGPSPNFCHRVGSTEMYRMSLYALALRIPITGTKGPSPNHEKQPQTIIPLPPNFTVSTMHSCR